MPSEVWIDGIFFIQVTKEFTKESLIIQLNVLVSGREESESRVEKNKTLLVQRPFRRRIRQQECFCILYLNCLNCPILYQKAKVTFAFGMNNTFISRFSLYLVSMKNTEAKTVKPPQIFPSYKWVFRCSLGTVCLLMWVSLFFSFLHIKEKGNDLFTDERKCICVVVILSL